MSNLRNSHENTEVEKKGTPVLSEKIESLLEIDYFSFSDLSQDFLKIKERLSALEGLDAKLTYVLDGLENEEDEDLAINARLDTHYGAIEGLQKKIDRALGVIDKLCASVETHQEEYENEIERLDIRIDAAASILASFEKAYEYSQGQLDALRERLNEVDRILKLPQGNENVVMFDFSSINEEPTKVKMEHKCVYCHKKWWTE